MKKYTVGAPVDQQLSANVLYQSLGTLRPVCLNRFLHSIVKNNANTQNMIFLMADLLYKNSAVHRNRLNFKSGFVAKLGIRVPKTYMEDFLRKAVDLIYTWPVLLPIWRTVIA